MKISRFIGICAVTASLALTQLTPAVMALENISSASESAKMQTALLKVKERVEIPDELTEFSSGSSSIGGEGSFRFRWSDKETTMSLEISCDSEGRILMYNKYDYKSNNLPGYIGVTRQQAQAFAEEFLKKLAPEAFADENDRLICDNYSFNNNYTSGSYSFNFTRYHNGNKVRFDTASVEVLVNGEQMRVEYAVIPYTYDAKFEDEKAETADPEAAYAQVFPMEMIYTDIYTSAKAPDESRLVYRINSDAEYISAYTGEILKVEENTAVPTYSKNEAALADVAASGAGSMFTPAELAEIEQIASLKSEDECVEYLKSIPMLQLSDVTFSDSYSNLYETDNDKGEYTRSLSFSDANSDRYISASFDAVRGRLTHFSEGYRLYTAKEPMTEAEISRGNAQTDAFLNIVASDVLGEFRREESMERDSEVCRRYVRMANDIPYISNTLYVDYNDEMDRISNYSLVYNNHAEFADPATAINPATAYDSLFEVSPLRKGYVMFGDEFKLVYYMDNRPLIDAITGTTTSDIGAKYIPKDVVYTDTVNHWSAEIVNSLKDMGIAFEGPQLCPDTAITQADLLRVFAAGIKGNRLMTDDIETIYRQCYSSDVITEAERSDTAQLTREQAFMYMVRFMGYEKIAKLPDIYKVNYADGDMLSKDKTGYAAILSGLGIINGHGSVIRPNDCITYAEALTMVYNYLTSPIR